MFAVPVFAAAVFAVDDPHGWADVVESWEAIGDSYRVSYARIRYAQSLLRATADGAHRPRASP